MIDEAPAEQSAMRREDDIVRTMLRLADTMVADYDELELLKDLVDSCVRILDADTAGIALGRGDRLGFVIATSEDMKTIGLFQAEQQQGPCLSAYRSCETVHSADLEADGHERWPTWTPRALELGFRSAEAFPMQLRGEAIGALNVYASRKRRLNDRDRLVGRAFADMATIGLLRERASVQDRIVRGQLQRALDSRVVIEQAKGILLQRHGITPQEAFDRLRRHARSHQQKLAETCRAVIEDQLDV